MSSVPRAAHHGGVLVRVNAVDGTLVWKADLKAASGRTEPPMWGFSCSPCVESGFVVVHAGGEGDKGIVAFNVADGQVAWTAPAGEMSYSSVQKITLLGRDYLCLLSNTGAHLLDLRLHHPVRGGQTPGHRTAVTRPSRAKVPLTVLSFRPPTS